MSEAYLVDIEGTVGSIAFVKNVLFPYARRVLPQWIEEHGQEAETRRWLDLVAQETGQTDDAKLCETLVAWIDADRKHTALKALQGLLWRDGYLQREYRAHLYQDAAEALLRWHHQGHLLAVYSSGSVAAQKLYFGHTDFGDLQSLFSHFFDTEIGGKRQAESFHRIAAKLEHSPNNIVFFSDVLEELHAARSAGLQTVLVDRLQDYPNPRIDSQGHRRVVSLSDF